MGRFIKGDVVVVPFPYTDLTNAKRRPALVLADLEGDDVILCQITSRAPKDKYAVALTQRDFSSGGFSQSSHVRPNKIFTAHRGIVLYRIGTLADPKIKEIMDAVRKILE